MLTNDLTALEPLAPASPPPTRRPIADPPQVIVVDDDPDLRELIALKLRKAGLDVTYACDGVDALNRIRTTGADLIVLDVMLPGKSGIDVCRELRQDESTAGIPVIMVTARGDAEYEKRGLSAGANLYLTKPFSVSQLLKEVHTLLNR